MLSADLFKAVQALRPFAGMSVLISEHMPDAHILQMYQIDGRVVNVTAGHVRQAAMVVANYDRQMETIGKYHAGDIVECYLESGDTSKVRFSIREYQGSGFYIVLFPDLPYGDDQTPVCVSERYIDQHAAAGVVLRAQPVRPTPDKDAQ
jgi:hypothetical protein